MDTIYSVSRKSIAYEHLFLKTFKPVAAMQQPSYIPMAQARGFTKELVTVDVDRAIRQRARRMFEEILATTMETSVPESDGMVAVTVQGPEGNVYAIAHYKLFTDGHFECFEVLDDALWPSLT